MMVRRAWAAATVCRARVRVPTSEARGGGGEELSHARGQGRWLGGATQRWKLGTATGRTDPAPEARGAVGEKQPEEWWLCGCRRA